MGINKLHEMQASTGPTMEYNCTKYSIGCNHMVANKQYYKCMVLRRSGCERCWQLDEWAVVGIDVSDGCRLGFRELGLQRQGARGPRGRIRQRHDGWQCVQGVDVEVEQRGRVQAECGGRGGLAHAAGTGAARCCHVWAAARQPDAGVVLRRSGCELCGRLDRQKFEA